MYQGQSLCSQEGPEGDGIREWGTIIKLKNQLATKDTKFMPAKKQKTLIRTLKRPEYVAILACSLFQMSLKL